MTTKEQFVAELVSWEGTPFLHQGRVKGIGVDCVGLVLGALKNIGIDYGDVRGYPRQPKGQTLIFEIANRGLMPVSLKDAVCGDILVMTIDKDPQHVGVLLDDSKIIHALLPAKKVVIQSLYPFWYPKIVRVFRFKWQH